MKKLLPIFMLLVTSFWLLAFPLRVFAVAPSSATTIPAASATASGSGSTTSTSTDNTWVSDPDVTFVGKTGARSGEFLDWTLQNYQWSYTPTSSAFKDKAPLETFWASIRNIVYAFLLLFILASAFILIITRGKNLTLRRFIWRFIIIVLLVTLSYAIIQFIYAVADIIQGFFLKNPDAATAPQHPFISQINLLNIGFNYKEFVGYRLQDAQYDESVFISLLLVKLTAITYYAMTGILLIRKIILWFFIVISPIFPLLLFYSPIRNTAKIWVGEFFRWLLYAPLFAILLAGLVQVWSNFIPLQFNFLQTSTPVSPSQQMVPHPCTAPNDKNNIYQDCYTTAVNILLGGPGQSLSINNSVDYRDTFAEYVVALLMLWVVIILPFLLLQIFLDYLQSFNFAESAMLKQLITSGSNYLGKPPSPAPPPPPPASTGIARSLPFSAKIAMPLPTTTSTHISEKVSSSNEILKNVNIAVPTLSDIAKFETSMLSRDISRHQEVSRSRETLEKLGNPNLITNPAERTQFAELRGKLTQAKIQGDPLASSVLSAASTVSASPEKNKTAAVAPAVREELTKLREKTGSTSILDKQKEVRASLPAINRVQSVSIEDYEAVKKMWEDTYEKLDPPKTTDGKEMDRKAWIQGDIDKVTLVTNLLSSGSTDKMHEGMDMVSKILPFLLIGGFSQTEVLAYLKAKQEAAKEVLDDMNKKTEDEETMVDRNDKKEHAEKEMHEERVLDEPKEITEGDKK